MNEATSTGENEQRRAASKRYQAQYRAMYDQLLEILFQLDPIGVHQDSAEKFVPELATILPRLRDARTADDVEQVILEELRHWYGRRRLANQDPESDSPTQPSPSAPPGITFSTYQLHKT